MNVRAPPPHSDRVAVEIVDGIADVRLDRPDKLNALDPAMIDALVATGERLKHQPGLRAVVVSGAGRGFCSGLDKSVFAALAGKGGSDLVSDLATRTHGIANKPQQAVLTWRDLPVPVIAAVHGVALGGGFQIALGADIRYVAPDARLSVLEVKWGLVPDMGGIALMRELARADVIKELAFTGRMFSGVEAVGYGLATAVRDDPHAVAMQTAREIAGRSPDAVRAIKRLMRHATDGDTAQILVAESVEQAALIGSPNQIEAINAAVENRAPAFADPHYPSKVGSELAAFGQQFGGLDLETTRDTSSARAAGYE